MRDRETLVNMVPATGWSIVLLNTDENNRKSLITVPIVAWANVAVEIEDDVHRIERFNKVVGIPVFDEDGPTFLDPVSLSNYVGYIQDNEIPEQKFGYVLEKK